MQCYNRMQMCACWRYVLVILSLPCQQRKSWQQASYVQMLLTTLLIFVNFLGVRLGAVYSIAMELWSHFDLLLCATCVYSACFPSHAGPHVIVLVLLKDAVFVVKVASSLVYSSFIALVAGCSLHCLAGLAVSAAGGRRGEYALLATTIYSTSYHSYS